MRSTSRPVASAPPCSSAAWPITAGTARGCSTRCSSPAARPAERSRSASCSTWSTRSTPRPTCSRPRSSCRPRPARPATGPTGWLFQLDHKGVAVTRVEFVDSAGDGRGWGLVFHLLETAGRAARCRLRLFRNPTWARQTDFQDELIVDLPIDDDAVLIDLTPHELARVEVTLG